MAEFKIDCLPETNFREAYVSPVDLLAIGTQVDFDAFQKTKELFNFALEHIECEVNGKWLPVKQSGRDVYMPFGIDKNLKALNELCHWYMDNVIIRVFTESAESMDNA